MLRFAFSAMFLVIASSAVAQTTGYTPPAGVMGGGLGGGSYGAGWMVAPGNAPGSAPPRARPAVAARPDQVRVGYSVYSTYGPLIGSVAYADSRVAVVKSPHWALRVPVNAFGVMRRGLLLDVSPGRFDKLAKAGGAKVG